MKFYVIMYLNNKRFKDCNCELKTLNEKGFDGKYRVRVCWANR